MKDVLIIGAGPAGCVAAAHLANQGYQVTIIEKEEFPRFQIGESLLPISMEHFEETGLLKALQDCNFEKKYGALFIRNEDSINIRFDENFTPGWTWTWQVPRDQFDQVLATEVEKKGVEIQFKSQLDTIQFGNSDLEATISKDGVPSIQRFRYVIDSSGSAGVLARLLPLEVERIPTGRKALFTQVNDIRAHEIGRASCRERVYAPV